MRVEISEDVNMQIQKQILNIKNFTQKLYTIHKDKRKNTQIHVLYSAVIVRECGNT